MSDEHTDNHATPVIEHATSQKAEPDGYDEWFRREVEAAVLESEATDAIFYTIEESNEEIARLRSARLLQNLEKAS